MAIVTMYFEQLSVFMLPLLFLLLFLGLSVTVRILHSLKAFGPSLQISQK